MYVWEMGMWTCVNWFQMSNSSEGHGFLVDPFYNALAVSRLPNSFGYCSSCLSSRCSSCSEWETTQSSVQGYILSSSSVPGTLETFYNCHIGPDRLFGYASLRTWFYFPLNDAFHTVLLEKCFPYGSLCLQFEPSLPYASLFRRFSCRYTTLSDSMPIELGASKNCSQAAFSSCSSDSLDSTNSCLTAYYFGW